LKVLTETVISLFDLAEAEGRLLKQKAVQTIGVGLLMLVAAILFLIALGLLLAALYFALVNVLTPASSYLIVSIIAALMAGGMLWLAMRLNRKP
jgi:multisubunit Na+/H+ antiporter MnhG subunit